MQKTFFKKIIPSMLIVAILATGFFGVFRVGVVNAEHNSFPESEQKIFGGKGEIQFLKKINNEDKTSNTENKDKQKNSDETVTSQSTINRNKTIIQDREGNVIKELVTDPKTGKVIDVTEQSITGCRLRDIFHPYDCIRTILAVIAEAMLEFFGFFVWISGNLLNVATDKTVLKMGANFKDSEGLGVVVKEAWKTIRDLSNIIIIFMLLVIGIGTILRFGEYGSKKLLGMLIAVAILINFSLFFTNVVIDASNLLALQFYNKVSESKSEKWNGFADSYMQAFGLSTWYSNTDNPTNDFSQTFTKNNGSIKNIFIIGILGSIMFLIASFAFLAGAFFLISRYVILIFLMIFSPIAFVGMILPATKTYTTQWVNMLFKQAFFAPIYFLLTWFVISIINSPAYKASLGLLGKEKFANLASAETFSSGSIDLVLNFIIVIFFIIASIILSQQMGIKGSSMVISWGQSARKWGQGMVMRPVRRAGTFAKAQGGGWAERVQEDKKGGFAKTLRMIPFANRAMGAVGAMGRSELKKMEDKYKDLSTANLGNLLKSKLTLPLDKKAISQIMFDRHKGDSKKQAKIFSEDLDANQRKEVYLSLSPVNRAYLDRNIKEIYKDKNKEEEGEKFVKKLEDFLSEEDKQKTRDADKEVLLKVTKNKITEALKKSKTDTIKVEIQKARDDKTLHKWSKEVLMDPKVFEHFTNADFDTITRLGDLNSNNKQYMYEKAKEMDNPPEFFSTPLAKKLYGKEKEGGIKSSKNPKNDESKIITENIETEFRNRNQK